MIFNTVNLAGSLTRATVLILLMSLTNSVTSAQEMAASVEEKMALADY